MFIPFLNPNIREADIKRATKALRSGWISSQGEEMDLFEKKFAKYIGAKHAVANSSGTGALHTSLLAAGVGPGDEVITTPLSFWATSNVILYVGAKVKFVDVEEDTGLIDPRKVEKAITKKTKAIIPVHLHGQMADMKELSKIAKKYGLKIIEDAPHALEAKRDGIRPGKLSFAACFSFHAAKNITCGEGGAVTVNDQKLAKKIKLFCDSGSDKSGPIRTMSLLGFKYSLTNFQAALLLGQLDRIDLDWKKRRKLYDRYKKALSGVEGITLLSEVKGARNGCHMFVILVNQRRRNAIREKIRKSGVLADIHYNPIHLEPYYKKELGYKKGMYPNAENIGLRTITLPLHTQNLLRRSRIM